ncbi:uncharacterized protein I206_104176 [Kwoniella pini CBS 10737]|uniref:SET domain-containing protein n=1 Tax=Kwoniella pini CBS 10737 TaxID=1296096 RepID=A0A1B9I2K3_9TREE|nr:uncharacterized protein I206_04249 [Kwoniella pini CBS 10737]OCF49725.1 hypothetical protein I206_04249 [Kwoniella pini CBS 10737]
MTRGLIHDCTPPPNWPESITYLNKSRLSSKFPKELISIISPNTNGLFKPKSIKKNPLKVIIKQIKIENHPAKGQNGLFSNKKIKPGELIIPYLGIIHSKFILSENENEIQNQNQNDENDENDEHEKSDYDLSLIRISSFENKNPFKGINISIGIDSNKFGNLARFVNDYRGINDLKGPNSEFKLGKGENGELQMEIWSLPYNNNRDKTKQNLGIQKGEEILVNYGKGWWNARNSLN